MITSIKLHKYLVALTGIVIDDMKIVTDEETTILYQLLKEDVYKNDNYFTYAKELFSRSDEHPRQLQLNLAFNAERAALPSLSISNPSDNPDQSFQSLGVGEQYYFEKVSPKTSRDSLYPIYSRYFKAKSDILISSSNYPEVLILYSVYRGLLQMILPQLNLNGFENPFISGREVQMNPELVPSNIYTKILSLNYSYEITVQGNTAMKVGSKFCEEIKGIVITPPEYNVEE